MIPHTLPQSHLHTLDGNLKYLYREVSRPLSLSVAYVPSCHEDKYFSCSAVRVSI
jgi:hypothetical protein